MLALWAGFVPYACVWACLIAMFSWGIEDAGVSDLVKSIIWVQLAVFTLFPINQL